MNNTKVVSPSPESVEQVNDIIIDSITDIKGKNIIKIDLRSLDDAPADYFIICDGTSNTQVSAIANRIRERTKSEASVIPAHIEGNKNNTWILIDYFDTIVHVFYEETRSFYDLEDLWSDGNVTEYTSL